MEHRCGQMGASMWDIGRMIGHMDTVNSFIMRMNTIMDNGVKISIMAMACMLISKSISLVPS